MLFIASRFESMWIPLGIGVAGFLSGMALAMPDNIWLCIHPFVMMLKPAIAMSAQPEPVVIILAVAETVLFLDAGIWTTKNMRYE